MTTFLDELPPLLPPPMDLDRAAGHTTNADCARWYSRLAERYSRNPHGLTCYAEEIRRALRLAERKILSLIQADDADADIIWCANGTEALNLALRGFPFETPAQTLAVDLGGHHALTRTARTLGRTIHEFAIGDDGKPDTRIPEDARLAALSLVNNETGAIWNGIRSGVFPEGCRLLADGCQAFGKHSIPWNAAHIDMLVLSGRKLGGPATGACLVTRKDLKLRPLIHGGGQQAGRLSGTVDALSMLLFAQAAESACQNRDDAYRHVAGLNQRLRSGLQRLGGGLWPVFSPATASPYILYFAIPGYQGALVARLLAANHRVLVGTGSACTAESGETSELLRRRGIPDDLARAAIRISLAPDSTETEIEAFLNALPKVLKDF